MCQLAESIMLFQKLQVKTTFILWAEVSYCTNVVKKMLKDQPNNFEKAAVLWYNWGINIVQ